MADKENSQLAEDLKIVIASEARRSSDCFIEVNDLQDTGLRRCARNDGWEVIDV